MTREDLITKEYACDKRVMAGLLRIRSESFAQIQMADFEEVLSDTFFEMNKSLKAGQIRYLLNISVEGCESDDVFGRVVGWIRTTCRRRCLAKVNQIRRYGKLFIQPTPECSEPEYLNTPDSHLELEELKQQLHSRIENTQCPDDHKALNLKYARGFSDAEIATEMSCTVGAVRSRLHRAIKRLRDDPDFGPLDPGTET